MSKFVEGQKVRVKSNLEIDKWYGKDTFVEDMAEYRGKIATISKVRDNGKYKLDFDNDDGFSWNWTDEMLDPVYCADCVHYDLPLSAEPCSSCSHNDNYADKIPSKFRVGEYVRIKDDLVVGKRYGNLTLHSGMDEFKGLVSRVSEFTEGANYKLEKEPLFYWSAEMLEPVHNDRLSVNPPSLEALEECIIETTRAIFEADEEHDQLETYELKFIENLLTACCKHKVIRLSRKEDNDSGDC